MSCFSNAALFSGLKKETFGGGRRFTPIRLDQGTIVTTAGTVVFKRRHCRDGATGKPRRTRYVTATIFDGVHERGKRNELSHRVLVSGAGIEEVAKKINSDLTAVFGLKDGDEVFLSDDLAA